MSVPLFLVEWDPTTDTAHVRATFDTVTSDEATGAGGGLDQFAACMRKLREIEGADAPEEEDRCTVCGIKDGSVKMRTGPRAPERTCRACAWLSPTPRAETDDETVDALGG